MKSSHCICSCASKLPGTVCSLQMCPRVRPIYIASLPLSSHAFTQAQKKANCLPIGHRGFRWPGRHIVSALFGTSFTPSMLGNCSHALSSEMLSWHGYSTCWGSFFHVSACAGFCGSRCSTYMNMYVTPWKIDSRRRIWHVRVTATQHAQTSWMPETLRKCYTHAFHEKRSTRHQRHAYWPKSYLLSSSKNPYSGLKHSWLLDAISEHLRSVPRLHRFLFVRNPCSQSSAALFVMRSWHVATHVGVLLYGIYIYTPWVMPCCASLTR